MKLNASEKEWARGIWLQHIIGSNSINHTMFFLIFADAVESVEDKDIGFYLYFL